MKNNLLLAITLLTLHAHSSVCSNRVTPLEIILGSSDKTTQQHNNVVAFQEVIDATPSTTIDLDTYHVCCMLPLRCSKRTHKFVKGIYPQANGAMIFVEQDADIYQGTGLAILRITNGNSNSYTNLANFIGKQYLDNGHTGVRTRFTKITKSDRTTTYENPVIEQGHFFY